jgi:hypothetical protein
VADPCRDDFPKNYVGDLMRTERGWVVVPPTCCPGGHDYSDAGWSVSSVWCTCNGHIWRGAACALIDSARSRFCYPVLGYL